MSRRVGKLPCFVSSGSVCMASVARDLSGMAKVVVVSNPYSK
jgi:hypothetical protein